jgi:dTDP-4-dehydrorhamnose reductase
MKIVVTGAGGGLGRALLAAIGPHHDLIALSHEDLDVGDHDAVMQAVPLLGPDLVINAAAFTAVDANELDPALAYRINAQGPQSLALAARVCGSILLHVSTDYVFEGTKGSPYDETDEPRPLSVYGRAKLAGERFVRHILPAHFIVRTAFLFGGGDDHLSRQVALMRSGERGVGIADRIGSPTYVRHLAERLVPLALTHRFGTYHLAGPEPTSWFELMSRARAMGGLPGEVSGQAAADLKLPAPRPENSSLVSVFVGGLAVPPMPPLEEALAQMLAS